MNVASKNPEVAPASQRLTSLDVYRGFVMLLMMAEVMRFAKVARSCPGSALWQFLGQQQTHTEWVGCTLHDLIQPSFSFLVGAALPFSLASRAARGQSRDQMAWHALRRSLLLILLGVVPRSLGDSLSYWTFEDTLTQIGLGYFFLFLLGLRPVRWQWAALGAILAGYWAAFALYPLPPPGFDLSTVGVPNNWPHLLTGFRAHWNKNTNLASAFDTWFLNLFSHGPKFVFNGGGYTTLSFIPTLGTMILGLIAGGVLRSERSSRDKVKWLLVAGGSTLLAGAVLGWLGVCPVVKRIWTPSWALFSGGWCFLLLAAFYVVIDLWRCQRWAFPLVVIGTNSITAYCADHVFADPIRDHVATPLGKGIFDVFGPAYAPLFQGAVPLLILWLVLCWLHRRRLFLRL